MAHAGGRDAGGEGFWHQRPAWLVERINLSFALAADPSFRGNLVLRTPEYLFTADDEIVSASAMILAHEATRSSSGSYRVLDIGAGEGVFLKELQRKLKLSGKPNSKTVGIIAQNERSSACDTWLRVTNAEHVLLDKLFAAEHRQGVRYDFIVSHETFRYVQAR